MIIIRITSPTAAPTVREDRPAVQSGMLAGLRLLRCKVGDVAAVIRDTLLIWLIDWLPNHIRRRILCKEYSGDALERRLKLRIFGGYRMVKALWRFAKVNRKPMVAIGSEVPHLRVLRLDSEAEVPLLSLARTGRPLVLNFGSCT